MNKFKEKITLNPVMTFLILILLTIVLSGFLNLIGFEATYDKINIETGEYIATSESVESLLSLSGIKYIFTSTVSNFTAFTPLSMLIIILIGIGIMEKSGFIKTTFTILTKYCKKYTITFWLVFLSVLMSITGDLGYVIMLPLSALMFSYGRRNPLLGIVATYAGLTCGSGIKFFLTSIDSEMLTYTIANANNIDMNYALGTTTFLFIMAIAVVLVSIIITVITERLSIRNVEKYEFKEEKKELRLGKREYRGLIFSITAGALYLLIFIYNIIPGLPFSGNFLDYTQEFYIDKLFSYNSFFSNGFVFIVTMFFIILGLFYGIGAKTIKNHNDFCEDLTHSLDGTGRAIILILLGSILINVFKKTNIGTVLTITLTNIIGNASLSGIPLIIALFLVSSISTVFLTNPTAKWAVISTVAIPAFMNSSLSPEFAQVIIAYIEKYNQNDEPISLFRTLKYQIPYSIATGIILILILLGWYLIGIPLGINGVITT